MGDSRTSIWWEELGNFFGKAGMVFTYIAIGLVAKLAADSIGGKLTRRQIIIKAALSIFAGYIASIICENTNNQKWQGVIIPVATLLGEAMVVWTMANWRPILAKVLPRWFSYNGKKKNNGK